MIEWLSVTKLLLAVSFVVAIFSIKKCKIYSRYFKFTYWKHKGVDQLIHPQAFFGHAKEILLGQKPLGDVYLEIYKELKTRGQEHGGIYFFAQPQYMPVNIKIIKHILHDDFAHFTSHGFYQHKNDTITRNLFRVDDQEWKELRSKLTRAFSAVRIKEMCQIMGKKCQEFDSFVNQQIQGKTNLIKIEDLATGFTIDVTVACIFGLEANSMEHPEKCEFRKAHRRFLQPNLIQLWLEYFIPPNILYALSYQTFPEVAKLLGGIIDQILSYRTTNNIFKNDLMNLLINLYTRTNKQKESRQKPAFTRKDIIAQAFVFFTAGYETSAATITFAMYELAKHQDIQKKLRKEILETMEQYNGELTCDTVLEMKYLDMVLHETLRKYPPVSTLPRKCTEDYLVPGTNLNIEKGTMAQISILGVHMDPEYYPDPERFDPARFSEENKGKRPKCTWIPFGSGPRMCLGTVFGMLQTKFGIIGLLKNHRYTLEAPRGPLKMLPGLFTSHSAENIVLNIINKKLKK